MEARVYKFLEPAHMYCLTKLSLVFPKGSLSIDRSNSYDEHLKTKGIYSQQFSLSIRNNNDFVFHVDYPMSQLNKKSKADNLLL